LLLGATLGAEVSDGDTAASVTDGAGEVTDGAGLASRAGSALLASALAPGAAGGGAG
jgi:hypothetical protein